MTTGQRSRQFLQSRRHRIRDSFVPALKRLQRETLEPVATQESALAARRRQPPRSARYNVYPVFRESFLEAPLGLALPRELQAAAAGILLDLGATVLRLAAERPWLQHSFARKLRSTARRQIMMPVSNLVPAGFLWFDKELSSSQHPTILE